MFFRFIDRKTQVGFSLSDQIATVETITGDVFSLIPSDTKPWLQCKKLTRGAMAGRLWNYPTIDPDSIFQTDSIAKATTIKGEVIDTLLALIKTPEQEEIQNETPSSTANFMELLQEFSPNACKKLSRENREEDEKPRRATRPKRKPSGKKSSPTPQN